MDIKIEEASSTPLYLQIKERIKEQIANHSLKPGTPLPLVRDLAASAGVGFDTAYKAVNELVKEGVCVKRPKKGAFVGGVLKSEVKDKIGVLGVSTDRTLDSFVSNLFESRIHDGVIARARQDDDDVMMISGEMENKLESYRSSDRFDLRGMLMIHSRGLAKSVELAEQFTEMRFVCLNYYYENFEETPDNVVGVFNDEFGGAYQMTERLIESGAKKIVFFNIDIDNENYRERENGCLNALRDHGLPSSRLAAPSIYKEED